MDYDAELLMLVEDAEWDLTGARVSAAKTRFVGRKATAEALRELCEALAGAGWDGSVLYATFAPPSEENMGRGWALRGATATARIPVPGVSPSEVGTRLTGIDPEEALTVEDGENGGALVTVRYMSDDQGVSDGRRELTELLRDAGIEAAGAE